MISRIPLGLPAETLRSAQLWVTIAVLGLAPLFFGAVDLFWVAAWAILLSLSTLCGLAAPLDNLQSRLLFGFCSVCGLYALVAIVQVAPRLVDGLADPNWQRANEILGLGVSPRISSRAEIPPLAAGHFLLTVTSFMSGF